VKLATAGVPSQFSNPVVGIVTRELLPQEARANRILTTERVPESSTDLSGYIGFLTTVKLEHEIRPVPTIHSVREIDHLRTSDILVMEPRAGFIRTLYRPDSRHK
jgi:hypothetical protein